MVKKKYNNTLYNFVSKSMERVVEHDLIIHHTEEVKSPMNPAAP